MHFARAFINILDYIIKYGKTDIVASFGNAAGGIADRLFNPLTVGSGRSKYLIINNTNSEAGDPELCADDNSDIRQGTAALANLLIVLMDIGVLEHGVQSSPMSVEEWAHKLDEIVFGVSDTPISWTTTNNGDSIPEGNPHLSSDFRNYLVQYIYHGASYPPAPDLAPECEIKETR